MVSVYTICSFDSLMFILGISDMEHDSAAALIGDAGIVAAFEEDKLSRNPARGVPHRAIEFCLKQAGIQSSDLAAVAIGSRPKTAWLRTEKFRLSHLLARHVVWYGRGTMGRLSRELGHMRNVRRTIAQGRRVSEFEHHLCHAASAYYDSPFDRALVLSLDESGDMWSGLIAAGEGSNLRPLHSIPFPNSLAWIFTQTTQLLGFRPRRDEHKVQWLGRDASPDYLPVFRKLIKNGPEGLPQLDLKFFGHGSGPRSSFSAAFYKELGLPPNLPVTDAKTRAAIARSLQEFTEEKVVGLATHFRERTGSRNICLAGGLFLNVLLVRAVEAKAGFDRVFVHPVPGSPGTALGAAHLAHHALVKSPARSPISHVYLGPEYDSTAIKSVLDNCKIIYRFIPSEEELLGEVVKLLRADKIVAWYQGRVEYGLRALGNRTILASPFSPYVTDNLNQYIKHREDFHPFAMSVPEERAAEFFDCTENCRFMASVGDLKPGAPDLAPFTFMGGKARVHTVDRSTNPRFWRLLHKFGEGQPAPVLVNTSFNLFGEPLVCDPREAVRSFYCSGIDAMVMQNFHIVK